MKPIPRYDFSVNVQYRPWEEDEKRAHFFKGIYEVILNHHIEIAFVPEIKQVTSESISTISITENILSQVEARIATVAASFYTVTPNDLLTGKEELIPLNSPELGGSALFYVTEKEFINFQGELSLVSQTTGRFSNSRKISELKEFEFARAICDRILKSKFFSQCDLRILGR